MRKELQGVIFGVPFFTLFTLGKVPIKNDYLL